jgi:hypothetical protein
MKTRQYKTIRLILFALAATTALAVLVACRVSQFGLSGDLVALGITPSSPVMAGGTQLQLEAAGVYSDGSTDDMTNAVTWLSSDPTVSVSSSGIVTANQVNEQHTCTITATGPGGLSGSVTLTIKNAQLTDLAISPVSVTLNGGLVTQLTATGTFTTGGETFTQDITPTVTWSTSNDAVATVDAGKVTGVSGGTAAITASWGGLTSNESDITVSGVSLVSLDIEPKDHVAPRMVGVAYTVTGSFSDGSSKDLTQAATWSSSDTVVARIGPYNAYAPGMIIVTLHIAGTTTISAKIGNMTASTSLIVSLTAPY